MAHTPSIYIRYDYDSLNAESIVDQASSRQGLEESDKRVLARKFPLLEVGCDRDAKNVDHDIVLKARRHPALVSTVRVKWNIIHEMLSSIQVPRHMMSLMTPTLV